VKTTTWIASCARNDACDENDDG